MAAAIEASEYERALATAGVGVWHWDIPHDAVRWSDQTFRLLGLEPDSIQVSLTSWSEFIHPDDRERAFETLNRFLAGAEDSNYFIEHRMRRADGSYIWVEGRGGLIRDPLGKPISLLGTVADVTARKESEAENARLNEQLRLFNELVSDYVYVVDLTSPSLIPSIVAGSFERTTGYRVEDIAGLGGWMNVMHPDDRQSAHRVFADVQAGKSVLSEYRIIDKHDAVRWLRDRIVPVMDPATGKLTKLMGGVTDITERKTLESQLLQAQKLEALARLAGSVAHDFNNLIMVLFAGIDSLKANQSQRVPPDGDALEDLANVAQRASELTASLLAFGRKQVSVRRTMPIGNLVLSTLPMLRRAVGERIKIRTSLPADDVPVGLDPGQLQLVLLNLSVNARDAMPEGGELTLSLTQETLDEPDRQRPPEVGAGRWAVLRVADRGAGMTQETMRRLFEPFFTTKPPGQGTGLGLSTCHGIIHQLGGAITAESREGEGSTFSIFLPVVDPVSETTADTQFRVSAAGTESILLVEDDPFVRRVVLQALRRRGYQLRDFESAEGALALSDAELGTFDLILSDVVLPGMNGVDMCEQLRARVPALRYMYMSGYVPDGTLQDRITQSGCVFLSKPFSPEGLATRVREALETKPA